MTDAVIQSNSQSVILASLYDQKIDVSYEIPASAPLTSKQMREHLPNNTISGSPHGQTVTFNVNRSYFLRDMLIETQLTTGTANSSSSTVGLRLFEYIEIRSNNKVIMTIPDAYLIARTYDSEFEKSAGVTRRALTMNTTTEAVASTTTIKVFTPIYCAFFESIRAHLDLNFYEQIQVVCKFNTQARMGVTNAWTSATPTLWVYTYNMDDKSYQELRAKNQRPDNLFNMLTYNTLLEKQTCVATTSNSIRFQNSYPCFKTHFFIKSNTDGSTFRRINSVTLRIAGTPWYEDITPMVANYEAETSGSARVEATETAITRVSDNIWTLNWGLLPQNRTTNSGAVSFAQINAPILQLNHETLGTAADNDIFVVHEFWQITSFDPNNGTISVTSQN